MGESTYTNDIITRFSESFPANWIDSFNWNNKSGHKAFLSEGIQKIKEFRSTLFGNLAKIVLSGYFFIKDVDNKLEKLAECTLQEFVPCSIKRKNQLQDLYLSLLLDIKDSVTLVRYHINLAFKHYEEKEKNLFTAVSYKSERGRRDTLVDLLDVICEACWAEYIYSYDEDYIRKLLMMREHLLSFENLGLEIENIRDATKVKIELMLYKLSEYYKGGKLAYNYNFKQVDLKPLHGETGKIEEFREAFLDYLDEKRWNSYKIGSFQVDSHSETVALWKYVLLMRYYAKFAKNIEQVEHLFELNEKHFAESILMDNNIIDKYADRSARNYMLNSRFSLLCSNGKNYTFERMKDDLKIIENIQRETFIFNYHPFQKAFEYTYSLLNKEIDSDIEEDILYEHLSFLEDCYKKFKSNVNWCRNNQPYILQLRFNYSIVDDTQRDVKIFCPSSFLRPLRFEVLDEKIISYNAKIGTIKGRIETIKDKRQILKVKNKLASIEKESFEKMSFFSTIIIFLVGLITIFTGNSSTITITDKMEYVAVLGVILLLFLCLSYFLTSTSRIIMKAKPWIFTILLILFSIYIGTFFCKHKDDSINTLMQNDATPSMIDTIQFEPRKQ